MFFKCISKNVFFSEVSTATPKRHSKDEMGIKCDSKIVIGTELLFNKNPRIRAKKQA